MKNQRQKESSLLKKIGEWLNEPIRCEGDNHMPEYDVPRWKIYAQRLILAATAAGVVYSIYQLSQLQ